MVHPHWSCFAISRLGNMTEKMFPELEDEFIKYFEVTKFKIHRISAEIVGDFTESWFTEDCFFFFLAFVFVSYEAGSFESFPFWADWWWGVSNDAILDKEGVLSLCCLLTIWDFKADFPIFPTLISPEQYWQNAVSESFFLTHLLYWSFFSLWHTLINYITEKAIIL